MNHITRRTMLQRGGMLGAVLALDAVSPALAGTTPAGSSARFKAIDAALRGGVSKNDVAGVVAMAATPKGVVYEGAFGKANVATGAAMTLDTVFWLLSMTKAFTATACMQLIEHDRLHLDDDAAKYLPELASPQVLEGFAEDGTPRMRPAKRAIKVRHLLTHTSGYTYSIWSETLTRYEKVTGMPDIATCKNAAFTAPLEFEPGERWEYGISMDWVGKLVEASMGYDLPAFKSMYDFDTWKVVEPPVGTVYGYPPRADEQTSIAGAPARSEVGAQIYNQAINTVMVAKVTQGNEKIDAVIKWAESELEGTLRA